MTDVIRHGRQEPLLPGVTARPRADGWENMWHVLGWFEDLPPISDEVCPVCAAEPGDLHRIITLGKAETIRLVLEHQP